MTACGGSPENQTGDGGGAATFPAARPEADAISEIELQVTGGPHAGRYTAKVTEGGCSYGILKPGAWGHAYAAKGNDPKQLGQLHLEVPESKAATAGTQNFWLLVVFGPVLGSTSYKIDTRANQRDTEGEGTVTVEDRGSSGTVSFDGKTNEGIGLKGTVRCNTVLRVAAS